MRIFTGLRPSQLWRRRAKASQMEEQKKQSKFDIVGSLPSELLTEVVKYLELPDVVRSRRVCKRWYEMFSSNTISRCFLRDTLRFLDLAPEETNVDVAKATSYFRWQHGLQCGRPVKEIIAHCPPRICERIGRIRYHSRRLCYAYSVDGHNHEVYMLNLETGERSTWANSYERGIYSFELSDRYLIVLEIVDSGSLSAVGLTAWNIDTKERLVQELPCFPMQHYLVKDKVIIGDRPRREGPSVVYVWDIGLNLVRKIDIVTREPMGPCLLHLDIDDDVLVSFQVSWRWCLPPPVQQTKWKLTTGELLEEKLFLLPRGSGDIIQPDHWRYFCPPTYGNRTVSRYCKKYGYNGWELHLIYDYTIDKLGARWFECPPYKSKNAIKRHPPTFSPSFYWLKEVGEPIALDVPDTPTQLSYRGDNREIAVPWSEPGPGFDITPRMMYRARKWPYILPPMTFGDKEVFGLVVPSEGKVLLWFFNPNLAPDHIPDVPGFFMENLDNFY